MKRIILSFLCAASLSACVSGPGPQATRNAATTAPAVNLPPMRSFTAQPATPTRLSNAILARDVIRLGLYLENGTPLPVLTKFEGPIRVRLTGRKVASVSSRDLEQLLGRLRSEARIDIRRVPASAKAEITIQMVDRATLSRSVPNAACFVAPNVDSWRDFIRRRGTADLNWVNLRSRTKMGIFIPADVSPQEIRDCLHEELAQALGPVNDLYDLNESVFNDDNFHTILTGYDMAILRAFYDPALKSGMSPDAVAAALPGVLQRTRGARGAARNAPGAPNTPASWRRLIEQALGAASRDAGRLSAASKAVAFARQSGWRDHRLGFALYALARIAARRDPETAIAALGEADRIFRTRPETRIHAAHVGVQNAAIALSAGRYEVAAALADQHGAAALQAQDAGLLASLLMIKSTALQELGRSREARIVEKDALGWARYAFPNAAEIRKRLAEIRQLPKGVPTRPGGAS